MPRRCGLPERARVDPASLAALHGHLYGLPPGSYAAFALGLAHLLGQEGLYDADFVENHCLGFLPWTDEEGVEHEGLRALLENEYTPERVARVCAIPAQTLSRLAREMARERPALVVAGPRVTQAENGLGVAMAVHALNALLGAIDREGGVLVQRRPPLRDWPEPRLD